MVRVLRFLPLITVCAISATVFADESPSRHSISVGVDLGYVDVSGYESWTEGSVGKLRHDSDGVKLSRAFLDYNVRLTDTLNATAVLQAYDDNLGTEIDFTIPAQGRNVVLLADERFLTQALSQESIERLRTHRHIEFSAKNGRRLLAAMRNQFGGHGVKKA